MGKEEATAHLQGDAASASAARRFIAWTLEARKCAGFEEAAILLASELVGNAVLHAGTDVDLLVARKGEQFAAQIDGAPPTSWDDRSPG